MQAARAEAARRDASAAVGNPVPGVPSRVPSGPNQDKSGAGAGGER
jgi:hypothetical protein